MVIRKHVSFLHAGGVSTRGGGVGFETRLVFVSTWRVFEDSMIQAQNQVWLKCQVRSWSMITSSRRYYDPEFAVVMIMGLQGIG